MTAIHNPENISRGDTAAAASKSSAAPATSSGWSKPNTGLFRTKSVEQSISETHEEGFRLKRELRTIDLIVFGVSVVIGAGIFTMTAQVAGDMAGLPWRSPSCWLR